MAKITETTTQAQLSTEKTLLGISSLTITTVEGGRVVIATHHTIGSRLGHGVTEAEAIELAFQRIRIALADSFKTA